MEIEKMSFEDAIKELEKIVEYLEGDDIKLEDSLEKFEIGVKLSSHCLSKLNEAEKKIEELTRTKDGKLMTRELDQEKDT